MTLQEVCQALVHELHEKNWCIGVGIAICPQVLYNIGVVDTTKEATLEFKSVKWLSMFFIQKFSSTDELITFGFTHSSIGPSTKSLSLI